MLKKSLLKRNKSKLAVKKHLKPSSKRIPEGKKVDEWVKLRKELFSELARVGIVSCELKYENCLNTFALGLCHAKKRRYIKTDLEMRQVCVGCVACHTKIEYMSKEDMYNIVMNVIKNRELNDSANK